MGKGRNKTRGKQPAKDGSFSRLDQQQQTGKTLQGPFRRLGNTTLTSWQDDHLPPMLWAALLTQGLPRDEYLECFRKIIHLCSPWFEDDGVLRKLHDAIKNPGEINFTAILDFDSLALVSDELFLSFIKIPLAYKNGLKALRPLLLLSTPPGISRWKEVLSTKSEEEDINELALAIGRCLDHQSESSTDIRWLKIAMPILAGRIKFAIELKERASEILDFPNRGDLRSVRPSIRAGEMSMRRNPPPAWVRDFWEECVRNTPCIDPTDVKLELKRVPSDLNPRDVFGCRADLAGRFFEVMSSERVDARLDASFGLTLYALSVLTTLAASRTQETVLGRLAIRSIVEARLTLAYLAKRDEQKIWSQWRVYGAGQVKLAFLKAQEITGDVPRFYSLEELQQLANEDVWQEFLDIDLGHWTKGNLRWMATEAGEKDIYDRFYSWSSGFVHAQWGAVRDTEFITCHNPLHRLHRIPRLIARRQATVEQDAVELINGMLDMLDVLYKGKSTIRRLTVALRSDPPDAGVTEKNQEKKRTGLS